MTTRLTKQQILASEDYVIEEVHVPEWAPKASTAEERAGFIVRVRSLSGKQRDAFEASLISGKGTNRKPDMANMRAKLCVMVLVDETGSREFTDAEAPILGQKNAAALNRVFTVAQRLSGFTEADVEDLEKNSEAGQLESSPSISA